MKNPPRDPPKKIEKTSFILGDSRFLLRCVCRDFEARRLWNMRNVIRILALILIWPSDSRTDEAPNETQSRTCRRNLKISLESIFREYENNNTICVSRFCHLYEFLFSFRCFVDH